MAYVVTDSCINCKHTDCVEICPVSCFHAGPNFVVIDPNECIDCNLCASECPVNAIYPEDELPSEYRGFIELNQRLSQVWPGIATKGSPMPKAADWALVKNKLEHLDEG